MGRFIATSTDKTWSYNELLRNTICNFCNKHHLNDWYSCNRRSCMINCHPGLLHNRRQHYYLVKQIVKYAVSRHPESKKLSFSGHPGAETIKSTYTFPHLSLPKSKQTKQFIRHGMSLYI